LAPALGGAAGAVPGGAQIIESWEPTEHDFGAVVIGESESQTFTFRLEVMGQLLVKTVALVTSDPNVFPIELYTGDSFSITNAPGDGTYVRSERLSRSM